MNDSLLKKALAEFIGTFALVLIGGAAVVAAGAGQPVIVPAIAHGFVVAAFIYAYGHVSDTHINPAVTIGLLAAGRMDITKAVAYWVAQFAGAIVAALVLSLTLGAGNVGPTTGSLTATNVWGAAILEFFATFLFVSVIFQAAVFGRAEKIAGLAIGGMLAAAICGIGVFTGASLNPARTLGPALFAGDLSYVLPYLIAIFGGGAAAGVLNTFAFGPLKA